MEEKVLLGDKSGQVPDKSTYFTVMYPEKFKINWKAFYDRADELTAATRKKLGHHLHIAYGDDPKQKLDLYLPKGKASDCSVFLFLHGGGFREGDRAHFGYVAAPFAEHHIITIIVSYRLAPKFYYPDQPDDVRRALSWTFHHIQSYGGNPRRIYIGGHSAGGILSAFVSLKSDWLARFSLPADLIKGCALISAPYDLRTVDWVSEYLPDPSQRAEASPLLNIEHLSPKVIIAVGSVDPPEEKMVEPSKELFTKLKEKGCQVELLLLDGMNHAEMALALGDEQSRVFQAILKMIELGK